MPRPKKHTATRMTLSIECRTKDHPQANGRQAQFGEQQWAFTFPLEDGSTLTVLAGRECRERFKAMLEQEELDDVAESNPRGN